MKFLVFLMLVLCVSCSEKDLGQVDYTIVIDSEEYCFRSELQLRSYSISKDCLILHAKERDITLGFPRPSYMTLIKKREGDGVLISASREFVSKQNAMKLTLKDSR